MLARALLTTLILFGFSSAVVAAPQKSKRAEPAFEYTPADASVAYRVLSMVGQGGISLVDWTRTGRAIATRDGLVAGGCSPYLSSDRHISFQAEARALQNIAASRAGVQVTGSEILSPDGYRSSVSATTVAYVGPVRVIYSSVVFNHGAPHQCVLLLEGHEQDG